MKGKWSAGYHQRVHKKIISPDNFLNRTMFLEIEKRKRTNIQNIHPI